MNGWKCQHRYFGHYAKRLLSEMIAVGRRGNKNRIANLQLLKTLVIATTLLSVPGGNVKHITVGTTKKDTIR